MKFFISCLVVLASVFFAATNSFAIGLEAAVGGWNQSIDGQLAYQSAFLPGNNSLDFENEAGFGDESHPFVRIKADLPILPNVYFMGTPMEFEGNGSKDFTFGGTSITGELYSKAKLDHYDLAIYYGVPFTGLATLGTLGIDLGINVRQMNIDMVVKDKSDFVEDSVNETIYIPMGFLAIQVEPTDSLAIEAELRGIAINNSHYYDMIGRLKLRFAKLAFAAVGWRHEDLEIDEKDIEATVKISGPFLEAGLQF
ncbi:MAG: TIGR04219 family outer membrane beta-barrel protein [Thermodesulfobacteriota bacterium]